MHQLGAGIAVCYSPRFDSCRLLQLSLSVAESSFAGGDESYNYLEHKDKFLECSSKQY